MRKNSQFVAGAGVISTLLLAPLAVAFEDGNNDGIEKKYSGIEKIVVSTQKRSQSIQEVPIAISSIDEHMAENIGADRITDVIPFIPGITGQTVGLASNLWTIRGISSNDFTVGSEPSVGVFIDDAYIGRNALATGAFFDIERVEVVKGPQGTLFGRNSAAGAINITTVKPEDDTYFELGAGFGNEGQRELNAMANVAVSDEFAVRFSYYSTKLEGLWKELTYNRCLLYTSPSPRD